MLLTSCMVCYYLFLYHELLSMARPLLQGNGIHGALQSHGGRAIPSSFRFLDGNFVLRKKRTKRYFLEWSLCHAFMHISCGLSVKELGIHSTVNCRGAQRVSALKPIFPRVPHLPAGYLKVWVVSGLAFDYWYCVERYSLYEIQGIHVKTKYFFSK